MKKAIDMKLMLAAAFSLQLLAAEVHGTQGWVDPVSGTTEPYNPGTPGKGYTDASGLSVEMRTVYNKELMFRVQPELFHEQFGKKTDIPVRSGNRIEFRFVKKLPKALTPLVEGVTPKPGKFTIYPKYAEAYQFGNWIPYTDELDLKAPDPQVSTYLKELAPQAALTCDTVVREIINAGTNVQFASKADGTEVLKRSDIDDTCLLGVRDVYKIAAILRAQNAPRINGDYVAIVHPFVINDLQMNAPDGMWQEWTKYTNPDNLLKGEVGKLGGVRFCATPEAKIFKGENFGSYEKLTVAEDAAANSLTVKVSETLGRNEIIFRWVRIGDYLYMVKNNDGNSITLDRGLEVDVAANTEITQGEGGKDNCCVFSTLFIADEAYGVVDYGNQGIEFIVKPLGYNDELNQRGSVGWKCHKGAVILHNEYMVRFESGSTLGNLCTAN